MASSGTVNQSAPLGLNASPRLWIRGIRWLRERWRRHCVRYTHCQDPLQIALWGQLDAAYAMASRILARQNQRSTSRHSSIREGVAWNVIVKVGEDHRDIWPAGYTDLLGEKLEGYEQSPISVRIQGSGVHILVDVAHDQQAVLWETLHAWFIERRHSNYLQRLTIAGTQQRSAEVWLASLANWLPRIHVHNRFATRLTKVMLWMKIEHDDQAWPSMDDQVFDGPDVFYCEADALQNRGISGPQIKQWRAQKMQKKLRCLGDRQAETNYRDLLHMHDVERRVAFLNQVIQSVQASLGTRAGLWAAIDECVIASRQTEGDRAWWGDLFWQKPPYSEATSLSVLGWRAIIRPVLALVLLVILLVTMYGVSQTNQRIHGAYLDWLQSPLVNQPEASPVGIQFTAGLIDYHLHASQYFAESWLSRGISSLWYKSIQHEVQTWLWQRIERGLVRPAGEYLTTLAAQSSAQTASADDLQRKQLLLALSDPSVMSAEHVTERLLPYWQASIKQMYGQSSHLEHADRVLHFYAHSPVSTGKPLFSMTAAHSVSVVSANDLTMQATDAEGFLAALIQEAGVRYKPVTLREILPPEQIQWFERSDIFVSGAFTQQAYQGFILPALIKQAASSLQPTSTKVPANADSAREMALRQAWFMQRYQEKFARAWIHFFQQLTFKPLASTEELTTRLHALSSAAHSPWFPVWQRFSIESAWFEEGWVRQGFRQAKQTTKQLVPGLLGAAEQPQQQVPATATLMALRRLNLGQASNALDSSKSVSPLLRYTQLLAAITQRWQQVQSQTESSSADLLQLQASIVSGQAAEWLALVGWIEQDMVSDVEGEFRLSLVKWLWQPVVMLHAELSRQHIQRLNVLWDIEVYGPWSRAISPRLMTKMGRSSSSGSTLPPAAQAFPLRYSSIKEFFHPDSGRISKFFEAYLRPLLMQRGNRWVPKVWNDLGVGLQNNLLDSLLAYSSLPSVKAWLQLAESPLRFELKPIPTPGLSEIVLVMDQHHLRYRNGPQQAMQMNCSLATGEHAVSLYAKKHSGDIQMLHSESSESACVNLLMQADIEHEGDQMILRWMAERHEEFELPVKFYYKPMAGPSLRDMKAIQAFTLPKFLFKS